MLKDPEKQREYRRGYDLKRYYKRRQEAITFLGGKCNVCESEDNLEIDHIDPNLKTFAISRGWVDLKRSFKKN